MSNVRFIGLDVHAETIAVAAAEPAGEVRSLGVIPNRIESIRKLVKKLGPVKELRVCYEAGPTGYVVYWHLTALGVKCEVVAPTLVPVKPGDRVKTDRRDALKLARSYRAGDLTPVWVPDAAHEALRDLVRAREAAKKDQLRARTVGQIPVTARPPPPDRDAGVDAGPPGVVEGAFSLSTRRKRRPLWTTSTGLSSCGVTIDRLRAAKSRQRSKRHPHARCVHAALQALRGRPWFPASRRPGAAPLSRFGKTPTTDLGGGATAAPPEGGGSGGARFRAASAPNAADTKAAMLISARGRRAAWAYRHARGGPRAESARLRQRRGQVNRLEGAHRLTPATALTARGKCNSKP